MHRIGDRVRFWADGTLAKTVREEDEEEIALDHDGQEAVVIGIVRLAVFNIVFKDGKQITADVEELNGIH